MQSFSVIYKRAVKRKGSEEALEALMPTAKTSRQLARIKDHEILAEMTKCVFRSGFVWKIIENKWSGFENAFHDFDVTQCAMLSDEDLEQLTTNAEIVRHAKKIASVRGNAQYLTEVRQEHGSFGKFLAQWPDDDFVGLWADLKKRGNRLGGQTGRFFLRFVGRDTPMFSADVVKALILAGVVEKDPTSKTALAATQAAFNEWRSESDRSYAQISRILACSVP
ncbi:MAG: 3-methyladenine DNA glycosylase Tag [Limisphaerales bacterium]|jgi:3-methyladenine DNA glycosylase Tag